MPKDTFYIARSRCIPRKPPSGRKSVTAIVLPKPPRVVYPDLPHQILVIVAPLLARQYKSQIVYLAVLLHLGAISSWVGVDPARVRPVTRPDDLVRRRMEDLSYVFAEFGHLTESVCAAELDPREAPSEQINQVGVACLQSGRSVGPRGAQMIKDHRHPKLGHHRRHAHDLLHRDIHLNAPSPWADTIRILAQRLVKCLPVETLSSSSKVEPHPTDPDIVHPLELLICHLVGIDARDTPSLATEPLQCVYEGRVVGVVDGKCDEADV